MWERDEDKLAVLELLETGRLRRRAGQDEAWTLLAELPWTRRATRRDEVELVAEHRNTLVELLDRVWPDWQLAKEMLADRKLAPTPTDWRRMQDLLRTEEIADLPTRLNRRTATSVVAPHSKAGLGRIRRAALGNTTMTRDGIVRMRAPPGTRFVRHDIALEATRVADVLGEVAITERALLDGTTLQGPVRAVLLVENLGPYQDLEPPEGWLVVHVPGWDTATTRLFLGLLPNVRTVHFGDLDPAGVRIFRHLQEMRSDLRWAVPEFWGEQIDERGLPGRWPDDLDLRGVPPLIGELARRGVWLEQELIAIDPRLSAALEAVAQS